MSWKDKTWKPAVKKLDEGDNRILFLDEGSEVEGTFGPQVLFRVQPLDAGWNPVGEVEKLYVSSAGLLDTLKMVPRLTGQSFNITRKGSGQDTTYEIKPRA